MRKQDMRVITSLDIAVLLLNLELAYRDKKIGHGDYNHTKTEIINIMNKCHIVPKNIVESLLWCANMLDDIGKFWHPKKYNYMEFVSKLCDRDEKFNVYYNYFESDVRSYEAYDEELIEEGEDVE